LDCNAARADAEQDQRRAHFFGGHGLILPATSVEFASSSRRIWPLDLGVLRTGILALIALIVKCSCMTWSCPRRGRHYRAHGRAPLAPSCSPSGRKIAFEPFTGDTQYRIQASTPCAAARPPDQRPQNPPPYCVAEPNHPPPNPPPPKKPHWGATCLTCAGMRSLAYRRCRSREAMFFRGASS
jgi:hypothetical protein